MKNGQTVRCYELDVSGLNHTPLEELKNPRFVQEVRTPVRNGDADHYCNAVETVLAICERKMRMRELAKKYIETERRIRRMKKIARRVFKAAGIVTLILMVIVPCRASYAQEMASSEEIAQAIFWAEGGYKTNHPYGILKKYKTTTPKQACVNTINHAKRDFTGDPGDFISFLGSRYCPVGSNTDNGTCKYWVKNVTYFLKKGAK